MTRKSAVNVDLLDIFEKRGRKGLIRTLAWGDAITVLEEKTGYLEVQIVDFVEADDGSILPQPRRGYVEPSKSSGLKAGDLVRPMSSNEVLKVNFVDVQQGDGAVIESPDGKVILVDGGDNQMFARYLAARFRGTTSENPREIECILVTHGDADHFLGLPKILESETLDPKRPGDRLKRLFIQPKRVYHNGIVKGPTKKNGKAVSQKDLLGPTKKVGNDLYLTRLVDDLTKVPDADMNGPFLTWKNALKTYNKRSKLTLRRLQFGDTDAFDFFNTDEMRIEVLGPLTTDIGGGKPGLKVLGNPPKGPRIGHESLELEDLKAQGVSASHTINGHSVVFRLSYRGVSFLFCGDLNDEASRVLAREHNQGRLNLRSDVFKVPHHGSADFSGGFIQAVAPIVSVVSSGDESARKEYIHPRSTLMGALGKWSRVPEPLIFVTELVAFFNLEGYSRLSDLKKDKTRGEFFAFSRTAYGIVKARTDGNRLLVYTDSGNVKLKEAYAYQLDASGVPQPARVVRG